MKTNDGVTLAAVYGGGCAACDMVLPVADAVARTLGIPFTRIDAEKCGKLLNGLGITRVPAVALIKDGKAVAECYGYQPEEILLIWAEEKLKSL